MAIILIHSRNLSAAASAPYGHDKIHELCSPAPGGRRGKRCGDYGWGFSRDGICWGKKMSVVGARGGGDLFEG
jgi:hypothetical protein